MTIQVKGKQYKQLVEALNNAYPSNDVLGRMLQFRLEKHLPQLAALPGEIDQVAFEVVEKANAQGWTAQLISAARESNPSNPLMLKLGQDFGLTAATAELERMVRDDLSFLDIAQWRERLGAIETQICRVEAPGTMGTGFLVGPDLVLTNYHVMQDVIAAPATAENVVLRFDYKRLSNGQTVNPGTEFRLATKWLVDSSPYSPCDLEANPGNALPELDQLDYALLRVEGEPGEESVAPNKADPKQPARGWMFPRPGEFEFRADSPVFIVQHPRAEPLKLALDTKGVLQLNANRTRVRYRTNTEPGSSGSPVFNEKWELVALHHSGDRSIVPVYNQGVPLRAIADLLRQRGKPLPAAP